MVATDLAESFRAGLSPHLEHARRVADPFHVVRAGNRCLDKVRRRVQKETLGHRGRKRDPLYRIRKLLLSGHERLDEAGHQRMLLGLRVGDPADKWEGVAAFCAQKGIDATKVLAIGDGENDVELLSHAAIPCAIAGACDNLVAQASHLIGRPGNGGWARVADLVL